MSSVKVYNFEGQVVGERELPAAVFGVRVNPGLIQQAVVAQQANARVPLAHTKTRGEVRGGGKKPWRQKGTGRARHGSIRSPLWIGGGITFGPRPDRNFSLKINRKMRRQALLCSLSAKAVDAAIVLVDDFASVGKKTKQAATLLEHLKLRPAKAKPAASVSAVKPVEAKKTATAKHRAPSALVVLPPRAKDSVWAFRNLPRVTPIAADSLNVVDVLKHRYLLLSVKSLEQVCAVYGPKTAVVA